MKEYIERDDALNAIERSYWTEGAYERVERLPAAEVVERKRGEWVDTREFCGDYMCSNCNVLYGTNKFNYCPNCGADMRGEMHEAD